MAGTRLVPLGGLAEIGLNCLALEVEAGVVLVDCGLMLPSSDYPGVDYLIPDLGYVRERRDRLLGVFLTHGHDDHVGAVPHLLQEIAVPVYGTPFTLELLDGRMKELTPSSRKLLQPVAVGGTVEVGPFQVEFLHITHSVPDSAALALKTPGGTVLCTGDFKLDPSPVGGRPTDEAGLARWGKRGVDLLCCDSTNAARAGHTPSERDAGAGLRRFLPGVAGRAYVATFASHIHRVQQVVEASRAVGRSVTFLGPSLAANVRAARRLGHLKVAPGDIVPAARAASLPGERLTVVATGLQGEPGAALSRVAHGRDPSYRLQPGDEVFLSGRTIPGSERAVWHLVDLCRAQGAVVRAGEEDGIHVSGHPSAEDVSRMLELVRPRHLLPVHGEARHREALAQVATDLGFPRNQIFRGGNGQALLLEDGEVRLAGQATGERMVVSSGRVAPGSDSLVRDRRSLGSRGVATAFAVVSSSGSFRWGPNVVLKGVLPSAEAEEGTRQAEAALRRHLADLPGQVGDSAAVEAEMRIALRRHFRRIGLEQPLILARAPMIDSGDDGPLQ